MSIATATAAPTAPRFATVPPARTDLAAAAVSWTVVPGLQYETRLDDRSWVRCDEGWYTTYIDLPAGQHFVGVRAVDPATGARSEAIRYGWVVEPLGA